MSQIEYVDYYWMGVDLGQSQDPTAIGILRTRESVWALTLETEGFGYVPLPPEEVRCDLVHLERVPLGTSYPDIVRLVAARLAAIPLGVKDEKYLIVDSTGVGRAVVDMMHASDLAPWAVTITGGDKAHFEGGVWRVPKRDLVAALQVLMQTKTLRVAEGLAEGETFVRELQNFKYKISTAGHDTYEAWREGMHDDLVLAVAIAAWMARRATGLRAMAS